MASASDKITDTRNATRPNSAKVSSSRSSGATTLACDNLTGWPTASKVHFVTYQIDTNSNPVSGTQLDCYGIVSGNNIGSLAVVDGTDNGNVIGDIVEMLPTAAWGQDLTDALLVAHDRTGAHKSGATYPLPVIADFSNANHDHGDTDDGGVLAAQSVINAMLAITITSGSNAGSGGGTTNYVNLNGLKVAWGVTSTFTVASATDSGNKGITFPIAFTSAPFVICCESGTGSFSTQFAPSVQEITASTCNVQIHNFGSGTSGAVAIAWLAIGN